MALIRWLLNWLKISVDALNQQFIFCKFVLFVLTEGIIFLNNIIFLHFQIEQRINLVIRMFFF